MAQRILAEHDRDRLRALLYGRTLPEVQALLPDVSADTAARAACGMPLNPATRRVLLNRLDELDGGAL